MARYSINKPYFTDQLTRVFGAIELAARSATYADKTALKYAALAIMFARNWTADTTELSRRECAKNVALLEDYAKGTEDSEINRALLTFANSLSQFLRCDYSAALKYATMAESFIR